MDAFLKGAVAGYGIAIPVGAIAVLIVEVGIRCGFRCAFFAGAGAATADFVYAGLAVAGGAALAGAVESVEQPLRTVSAVVLAAIAVVGLRGIGRKQQPVAISFLDRRDRPAPVLSGRDSPHPPPRGFRVRDPLGRSAQEEEARYRYAG